MQYLIETENELREIFSTIDKPLEIYKNKKIDLKLVENDIKISHNRIKLIIEKILKLLPNKGKILDIGTSFGLLSVTLLKFGYSVNASDIKENINSYGKLLFQKKIPNKIWDLHFDENPYTNERFDLIVISEVLEHLYISYASAIKKIIGLLNDCGYLIITVPNFYSYRNFFRIIRGKNIIEEFPDIAQVKNGVVIDTRIHPREPLMYEIKQSCKKSGLKILYSKYFIPSGLSLIKKIFYHLLPSFLREHFIIICKK